MAAILMDLFRSLKMPLNAASLMIGIPVLVALGLYNLHARHLHVNVNWWYYPSFFLIYAVYVLPILFFALFVRLQPKPSPPSRPKTKFICFVPAYNEQDVIANPVCSLLRQDYPKDLYDIWVIFDGNDQTGERARALGVNVLETPTNGFGKQRALMWAFRRLLTENDERYACIFDADNVASENYLSAMNNAIQANGYRCLQSFHNVLNGPKNWITKALWCSCFSSSRLYLMGRMGVLRNALMCGTGWCCEASLLREYWPKIKTQTEDIELNGILALEEGIRVAYVPEAAIYDEKPVNIWVAARQRMRWMCGHARVARFYFVSCMVKGLQRRDPVLLELALYYLVPFALLASVLTAPVLVGLWIRDFDVTGPLGLPAVGMAFNVIAVFFLFLYQILGFYPANTESRNPIQHWYRVVLYSLYTLVFSLLAWPPALIWAIFRMTREDWIYHTPHVTDASTDELVTARPQAVPQYVNAISENS